MFTDRLLVRSTLTLVQSRHKEGVACALHLVSITWYELTKMVEVSSSLKWNPQQKPKHPGERRLGGHFRYSALVLQLLARTPVSNGSQLLEFSSVILAFFTAVGLWDFQPAMMMTQASRLVISLGWDGTRLSILVASWHSTRTQQL